MNTEKHTEEDCGMIDIMRELYNPNKVELALFRLGNVVEVLRREYNTQAIDSAAAIFALLYENTFAVWKDLHDALQKGVPN